MQIFSCSAENVLASTTLQNASDGFEVMTQTDSSSDSVVVDFCFEQFLRVDVVE
jgi:hypothetical protein